MYNIGNDGVTVMGCPAYQHAVRIAYSTNLPVAVVPHAGGCASAVYEGDEETMRCWMSKDGNIRAGVAISCALHLIGHIHKIQEER